MSKTHWMYRAGLGLAVVSSLFVVSLAEAAVPGGTPTSHDFGQVVVGETSGSQTFTLDNSNGNTQIVGVTLDDTSTVTLTPPAGLPVDLNGMGATTTFSVVCHPQGTAVIPQATITVEDNDGADDLTIAVDCDGISAREIAFSPTSFPSFGNVAVGGQRASGHTRR